MPSAPKRSQSLATCSRSGMFPPRALRSVAILLILTLSRVIIPLSLYTFALKGELALLHIQR